MRRYPLIWKILYWLAVVAISLVLVVGLILLLESRDESGIEGAMGRVVALSSPAGS